MVDIAVEWFPETEWLDHTALWSTVLALTIVRIRCFFIRSLEGLTLSFRQLVTTVLVPRKPRKSLIKLTTFATYSVVLWPIALLIVGIRAAHTDWSTMPPPPSSRSEYDLLGSSVWGGIGRRSR
jgi:hypothetical protein